MATSEQQRQAAQDLQAAQNTYKQASTPRERQEASAAITAAEKRAHQVS